MKAFVKDVLITE